MDPDDRTPDLPADGSPRPDPELPAPAEPSTPVPQGEPDDEPARQAAATIQSVSRLEEAN